MFSSVQDLSLYCSAEDPWTPEVTVSTEEVLQKKIEEICMINLGALSLYFLSCQKYSLMTTLAVNAVQICTAQTN